ncbi:hypothetical protein CLH39_18650 [Alcaligenes faecalis]|nr:hypothetical protein CLH39_18650 [Alcaligenes faecalis]
MFFLRLPMPHFQGHTFMHRGTLAHWAQAPHKASPQPQDQDKPGTESVSSSSAEHEKGQQKLACRTTVPHKT